MFHPDTPVPRKNLSQAPRSLAKKTWGFLVHFEDLSEVSYEGHLEKGAG